MSKLNFYEIDKEYIKFLKQFDNKIPNIDYETNDKFVCGVVFSINDINYFAPISSFNKQQKTNFLIYNEDNMPISSVRLSYMFPAADNVIRLKDFSKENYKYKLLLKLELDYCNRNREDLLNQAMSVYKIGINKRHPLAINCCNFKLLEEKYIDYINDYGKNMKNIVRKEVAADESNLSEYTNIDKLKSLSKDGNGLSLEQIKAIYLFMKDKVKKGSLDKNDPTFNLLSQINDELNNKLSGNQSSQGIKFDNSSSDMHLK